MDFLKSRLIEVLQSCEVDPSNIVDKFMSGVIKIVKKRVLKGNRKKYIPGWNNECRELYNHNIENGEPDTIRDVLQKLNVARKNNS